MIIILMGVAGSGKTTVGEVLARRLGWPFRDADEFHPPHNIKKMQQGIPLSDDDRRPWLEAIRAAIEHQIRARANAIFACSALKQVYRESLTIDPDQVRFVYLEGSPELIAARLASRKHHFFGPNLLQSQFEALEEPHDAIRVDISPPAEAIAGSIIAALHLPH